MSSVKFLSRIFKKKDASFTQSQELLPLMQRDSTYGSLFTEHENLNSTIIPLNSKLFSSSNNTVVKPIQSSKEINLTSEEKEYIDKITKICINDIFLPFLKRSKVDGNAVYFKPDAKDTFQDLYPFNQLSASQEIKEINEIVLKIQNILNKDHEINANYALLIIKKSLKKLRKEYLKLDNPENEIKVKRYFIEIFEKTPAYKNLNIE